jgi:hypothetical protein
VHQFCPKIVFISEIRQQQERVSNLCFRLGYKNAFVVNGKGKGGGLVIYWDEAIKLSIVSYGLHYIDTLIWDSDHHVSWRGTFVYGEPRAQDRHDMWGLLKILKRVSSVSWMLIGEFNEVMWSFEHLSSRCRPERQMQEFREVLEFCDVFDLGFSGWTYDNRQSGERNVKVRLDHAVASSSWSDWF